MPYPRLVQLLRMSLESLWIDVSKIEEAWARGKNIERTYVKQAGNRLPEDARKVSVLRRHLSSCSDLNGMYRVPKIIDKCSK